MTPATFMKRYNLAPPKPLLHWGETAMPEIAPYAKLTRSQLIQRIRKHYRLSATQLAWDTVSLRYVLDTYEPEA